MECFPREGSRHKTIKTSRRTGRNLENKTQTDSWYLSTENHLNQDIKWNIKDFFQLFVYSIGSVVYLHFVIQILE